MRSPKHYVWVLFAIIFAAVISYPYMAQSQVLDALRGHARELQDRQRPDAYITGKVIKKGMIDEKAKGQDPLHNSHGEILVIEKDGKRYLQLAIQASPGPDYHVYVSKRRGIKDAEDFVEQVEVSRLLKPNGASYYLLPEGVEVNSVTIWCKQFKEYIGSADLK